MEQEEEYIDKSSKVGKLILRLNQLEKRPALDNSLGEILDLFLQSLIESEDFFKHGLFKINFAEAALLLQSSSLIYSKKVDLLWDVINEFQKRLISFKSEENEIELKRIEERERKYKRRRRQIDTSRNEDRGKSKCFPIDWKEIDDFQHINYQKDSKLYSGWYKKMVFKWDIQPTPRSNRTLSDKQIQFRSIEDAIFDQDQENEFVVHTSKMESVIRLEELLLVNKPRFSDFPFKLYSELYLIPNFLKENHLSFEDLEKHSVEVEKYIEKYKDQYFVNRNMYVKNFDNSSFNKQNPQKLRRVSISSTYVSRLDMSDLDNIYVKKCQVNLLRLSVDDLSRLSRLSIDELKKSFYHCCEGEDSKSENFQENFSTERKVDIDCHIIDSSLQIIGDKDADINISSTGKLSNCSNCGVEAEDEMCTTHEDTFYDVENSNRNESSENKSLNDNCLLLNKTKQMGYKRKSSRIKIKTMEIIEDDDIIPEKRRKLSKAALKKLVTGITVDLEKFNTFFATHYQPEEGEGMVELPELKFDDPIDSSSRIGIEDASQLSDHPILCTQDSGYESHFQDNEDTTYVSDINSPVLELNDQTPQESLHHELNVSENQEEEEGKPLYQRVYDWKQYMSEKFKDMKSTDFDIHEYGSNIMENFQEGHPQKFKNIVKGKSAAEVTRYFISALQLANTCNIEIQGVQSGKLSNETFQLKLITKERYYDRLKDYMAPSEQDYHRHLDNMRKMKKRSFPSSSGEFSGSKRNK